MRIEYVGHATVVVELDDVRLVTDPLLRSRLAHLRRAVPVDATGLRGLDAVLISHAHYDHLDLQSLERIGRKVPVILPRGLGGLLRKRRFESVVEVDVGDVVTIGSLEVRAVAAEHDGIRFGAAARSLGYSVVGSCSVYFAGDTDLFEGMAELASPDVALLPVWGWGRVVGRGHLDPMRAAQALTLLRPRVVVPIHWGTYFPLHLGLRGAPGFLEPPPAEFAAAAKRLAPEVEVRILRPGESQEL